MGMRGMLSLVRLSEQFVLCGKMAAAFKAADPYICFQLIQHKSEECCDGK